MQNKQQENILEEIYQTRYEKLDQIIIEKTKQINKPRRKRKHKKRNNNGRNVQTGIQRRDKSNNTMSKNIAKK